MLCEKNNDSTLTMDMRGRCVLNSARGNSAEKSKCGGVNDAFGGEGGISGGAENEVRLRRPDLRGAFFVGERTGDEDSAPDWKIL